MNNKNKKISKKKKLEECYQNLEQAKISNNKIQIRIWADIVRKLENDKKDNTN